MAVRLSPVPGDASDTVFGVTAGEPRASGCVRVVRGEPPASGCVRVAGGEPHGEGAAGAGQCHVAAELMGDPQAEPAGPALLRRQQPGERVRGTVAAVTDRDD